MSRRCNNARALHSASASFECNRRNPDGPGNVQEMRPRQRLRPIRLPVLRPESKLRTSAETDLENRKAQIAAPTTTKPDKTRLLTTAKSSGFYPDQDLISSEPACFP